MREGACVCVQRERRGATVGREEKEEEEEEEPLQRDGDVSVTS